MINPASGNGVNGGSAFGATFSDEVEAGVTQAQALATAAETDENVYTVAEPSALPPIYDTSGALISDNSLRAEYTDGGTYLGSFGLDSQGHFAAWNSQGVEHVINASGELADDPAGATPFSFTGSPVLYDASGNIAGYEVSGFVQDDNLTPGTATSSTRTDTVYDATGTIVGSLGFDAQSSTFDVTTSDGTVVDATSWLSDHGLATTAAAAAGALEGTSTDGSFSSDRATVERALESLLAQENNNADGTDVGQPNGVLKGSYGFWPGTNFELYDASGTVQSDPSVYLEALGITQAEIADVAVVETQISQGTELGSNENSAAGQELADINAALTAYVQGNVASQGDAFVSAFSTAQVADVFSDLSPTEIALISPDALSGLSPALFANATAAQIGGLGANAVGLTSAQLQAIANRAAGTGNLSSLSTAALGSLTSTQVAALTSTQIRQFTSAQLSQLTTSGALSAAQIQLLSDPQTTITPADGNGSGSTSAYGASFSNEILAGIEQAETYAASAEDTDAVYTSVGSSTHTVDGANHQVIPADTLRAVYNSSGTYLGSYGIDPSTGKFAAWNAEGVEQSLNSAGEAQDGPSGTTAFSFTGAPVLYDASGNITGFAINGFIQDDNLTSGAASTSEVTDAVYDASGNSVGFIGYDPNNNWWDVRTASGTTVDATNWLTSQGISEDTQQDVATVLTGSNDSPQLENEKASIENALEALLAKEDGAAGNDLDQTSDVDGGAGNLKGTFGYNEDTDDFSVFDASGNYQGSPVTYLEALGITTDEMADVGAAETQNADANLSPAEYAQLHQESADINAALETYIHLKVATQGGDAFVSALSSSQIASVFDSLSATDVALVTPDAIAGLAPSVFANADSWQIAALQNNAVGLTANQLAVIASRSTGNLASLSANAIAVLSAGQTADLTPQQLQQFSSSQIATLQQSGALTADQLFRLSVSEINTGSLTSSQVQNLTSAQLSDLSSTQWASLDHTQLSTTQIQGITSLANVGTAILNSLTSTQRGAITTFAGLSATQIAQFTATTIAQFGATAFATLSSSQLGQFTASGNLTGAQIGQLTANAVGGLTSGAVANLTAAAIGGFDSNASGLSAGNLHQIAANANTSLNLSAFGTTALASLTQPQTAGLSVPQLGELTIPKFGALVNAGGISAAQLLAVTVALNTQTLSSSDASALTSAELSDLSASQWSNLALTSITAAQFAGMSTLANIPNATLALIPAATLGQLSTTLLGTLTAGQVNDITTTSQWSGAQIAAFAPATFAGLQSAALGNLTSSGVSGITADQIGLLTPAQVGELANFASLSAPAFDNLSVNQISVLSVGQAQAITTQQIVGWSAAQVAALQPQSFASLSDGVIAALSNGQVGDITEAQTQALSAANRLSTLSPLQISGLSGAAVAGFGELKWLSSAQLGAITAAQAGSLTTASFSHANTSELDAIAKTTLVGIAPTVLASISAIGILDQALTPTVIANLASTDFASFTYSDVQNWTNDEVSALSDADVAEISSAAIGAFASKVTLLSSNALSNLSDTQVQGLSTAEIAALSPEQFASFSSHQIGLLNQGQVEQITGAQIAALGSDQVSSIANAGWLTGDAFSNLDRTQISALTSGQIQSLTTAQIQSISAIQAQGLTSDQAAAFTSAALQQIQSESVSSLSTDFLGATDVTQFTSAQQNALSTSQIQALSINQIKAFSATQINALQSRVVSSMTSAQIHGMTASEAAGLTLEDIRNLQSAAQEQTSHLSAGGIADIDDTVFSHLDAAQMASLSVNQIASLDTNQLNALATNESVLDADQRSELDSRRAQPGGQGTQSVALTATLSELGVTTPSLITYDGTDTVADNASILDPTYSSSNGVLVFDPNSQETLVPVTADQGQLADGEFATAASGGVDPSVSPSTGVPTLASNQMYIQLTPFQNLVGTATGGGWYRATFPSNPSAGQSDEYQISYNPSNGKWDFSDDTAGHAASNYSYTSSFADAYSSYVNHFGATPGFSLPSGNYITTSMGSKQVVATDSLGYTYINDPNTPKGEFQIGYRSSDNSWNFRDQSTGNDVVGDGLNTDINPGTGYGSYPETYAVQSYEDAYALYQQAYGNAPPEATVEPVTQDNNLKVAAAGTSTSLDGIHTFSSAAGGGLIGGTGILTGVDDDGDASIHDAAVIGATGSLSQSVNLNANTWYALTFSAVASAFKQTTTDTVANTVTPSIAAAASQTITITLDAGTANATTLGQFTTAALTDGSDGAGDWQQFASAAFQTTAGSHTITFTGSGGATASVTLGDLQLQTVTPTSDVALPAGSLENDSADYIRDHVTALQLFEASDADLQALTPGKISELSAGQIQVFFGENINRFGANIANFTAAQIGEFEPDQIGALGAATLSALSDDKLTAVQSLAGISDDDLATLAQNGTLGKFSAAATATLTKEQLATLDASAVASLNSGAWNLFTASQISGFSSFQLAAISGANLAQISTSALAGLPYVSSGTSLADFVATPGSDATQATGSALGTALTVYDEDVPGATPDFAAAAFIDASLATGSFLADDSHTPTVAFSGTAGITADNSALNFSAAAGIDNESTDASGYAAYVQGSGSFAEQITGLSADEDYQIGFNAAQGVGSDEKIQVWVDGVEEGEFTPDATYGDEATQAFTITTAGPHTVEFKGVDASGTADAAVVSGVHIALAGDGSVLSGGAIMKDGDFAVASAAAAGATTETSPWTFGGNAGVQNPLSAAYVGDNGSLTQIVGGFEDNRTYGIAFDLAQIGSSTAAVQVLIDGHVVDTVTAQDSQMRLQYSATFAPGAGSHTITFEGVGGSGTAMITNVRVLGTGFQSDQAAIANGVFDPTNAAFDPTQTAWQFDANSQSGIIANSSSTPVASAGTNAAYLNGTGEFSQQVDNFQEGETYALSFRAADMPSGGNAPFKVLVDGTVVGTFDPTSQYQLFTTSVFAPGAGTHRITFEGMGGNGTALISDVELVDMPDSMVSFDDGSDGAPLLSSVPSQDQIQRLQWASVVASVVSDNYFTTGGDDLISMTPDTSGIVAVAAAHATNFLYGWSNGSSQSTSTIISSDNSTITQTVRESEGGVYQTQWDTQNNGPSGESYVSQTTLEHAVDPTSGDGSLPVNAALSTSVFGALVPTTTTIAAGTGTAPGNAQFEHAAISPFQVVTNTGGTGIPTPPAYPAAPMPQAGGATIGLDPGTAAYIADLYETNPAFHAQWDALIANPNVDLEIAFASKFPNGAAGDTFFQQTNGTYKSVTTIYINQAAAKTNGLNDTLSNFAHEISHEYSDQEILTLGDGALTGTADPNFYKAFAVSSVATLNAGLNYVNQAPDVPDADGAVPLPEVLAYFGQYAQMRDADELGSFFMPVNPQLKINTNVPPGTPGSNTLNADQAAALFSAEFKVPLEAITTVNSDYTLDDATYSLAGRFLTALNAYPPLQDGQTAEESLTASYNSIPRNQGQNGSVGATPPPPPAWISAQQQSLTVNAFVQFVDDLQAHGFDNDLVTIAAGFKLAGLLPNVGIDISNASALEGDAQFMSMVSSLLDYFKSGTAKSGYAAASAIASFAAQKLVVNYESSDPTGTLTATYSADYGAEYATAIASVLQDLSSLTSAGTGSLQKDVTYLQETISTAESVTGMFVGTANAEAALGKYVYGVGDVASIVEGFEQGGLFGGLQAGYSANALIDILATSPSILAAAPWLTAVAGPVGVAIGLAAFFFGGTHDDPASQPDKYDTANYGQGVANLQGSAGANGQTFSEDSSIASVFSGRTGIQMIEETLAYYGSAENAPDWLKPMFANLEAMFGESATGSGILSVGDDGDGKDANNQRIIGVSGTSGGEYQYTDLDAGLAKFEAAYSIARSSGQAPAMAWYTGNGNLDPSSDYASSSGTSNQYYA